MIKKRLLQESYFCVSPKLRYFNPFELFDHTGVVTF